MNFNWPTYIANKLFVLGFEIDVLEEQTSEPIRDVILEIFGNIDAVEGIKDLGHCC